MIIICNFICTFSCRKYMHEIKRLAKDYFFQFCPPKTFPGNSAKSFPPNTFPVNSD